MSENSEICTLLFLRVKGEVLNVQATVKKNKDIQKTEKLEPLNFGGIIA